MRPKHQARAAKFFHDFALSPLNDSNALAPSLVALTFLSASPLLAGIPVVDVGLGHFNSFADFISSGALSLYILGHPQSAGQ